MHDYIATNLLSTFSIQTSKNKSYRTIFFIIVENCTLNSLIALDGQTIRGKIRRYWCITDEVYQSYAHAHTNKICGSKKGLLY